MKESRWLLYQLQSTLVDPQVLIMLEREAEVWTKNAIKEAYLLLGNRIEQSIDGNRYWKNKMISFLYSNQLKVLN